MKKIIPITDLQRQAGQIISDVNTKNESVIITQRGRPAAVIMAATQYSQIEEDLRRLDELEAMEMVARSREEIAGRETISHQQIKSRLQKRARSTSKPSRRAG